MKTLKSSICLGCTLLCDDVEVKVDQHEISLDTDCPQSHRWAENVNRHLADSLIATGADTDRQKNGKKTGQKVGEPERMISDRLLQARSPLVVGLNHLTTESQQLAWQVADVAGALIDVTLSKSNRSELYAMQRHGKVTATLGQIARQSDLVVLWFCDPVATHPRLMQRLNAFPSAPQKRVVVVESANQPTAATAAIADEVYRVEESNVAEFVGQLRSGLRELKTGQKDRVAGRCAIDSDAERLAQTMARCDYGSFFSGDLDGSAEYDTATMEAQALIRELNDHTRFVSLSLRSDQNAIGGENVLAAFSGFPVAVNLGGSGIRYNGSEFAAESILENGECDFVLLFAGWGTEAELDSLSPVAKSFFDKVPKVVVTSDAATFSRIGHRIVVARPGVERGGEWCRVDDISLGLSPLVNNRRRTAQSLLHEVLRDMVDPR